MSTDPPLIGRIRTAAAWLLEPELGTCVVGTAALAEAARRADCAPPPTRDLDLAWALDVDAGSSLLDAHGVKAQVTANSLARGTLAFRLAGERVEVTTFRGDRDGTTEHRIETDLARRESTIAAVAWWLREDRILDPFGGVNDWRMRHVEAVGEPMDRMREHPIRWLRWFRKAHSLSCSLSSRIRRLSFDPAWLRRIPAEAVAAELRSALLDLDSPGRLLLELHEAGGLATLAPELAPQFDGRPAGPVRHHPEVGQALHLILALEWAAARTRALDDEDRAAVLVAVLCHDLGKGLSPPETWPSHHGHEARGVPLARALLDRLPGLTDRRGRRLTEEVCRLHLTARRLRDMRPGSLARLYDDHFRSDDFPVELFALAIGADSGGRLDRAEDGETVHRQVVTDLRWLRATCASVNAASLRRNCPDVARFRDALHEARASALRRSCRTR